MWSLFSSVFNDWSGQTLRIAGQHGLTMSEVNTLYEVNASGSLSLSEISRLTGLSKSATSQLVERLVRQGLLSRQESPHSRRQKQVSLTPDGRGITDRFDRAMLERLAESLGPVPDEPILQLQGALEGVLKHLQGAGK